MTHIHSLYTYPIKSCRGMAQQNVTVERRGFTHDRRWIIVDRKQDNKFITQRSHGRLARIETSVDAQGALMLSVNGQEPITIVPPRHGNDMIIPMWKETAPAYDVGDAAAAWLQAVLGDDAIEARLCYQADEHFRPVDPVYGQADDPLSFADGSPVLITNMASLADLNARLPEPVPMDRFRANIVLDGLEAFAEDHLTQIKIGDVIFDVANACDRCKIVTLDQHSGEPGNPESNPLKALGEYRRGDKGKIYFGVDAIPRTTGVIKVGDTVEILAQCDIPHHLKDAV
jgi:uncharacterized protein YcbX